MKPIAVVTGGSSGLGAGCVEAFREAGYQVASIDLNPGPPRDGVFEVKADVTDAGDVERAFEEVSTSLGAPTAMVHAAGVYPRFTLQSATTEAYRHTFDINVLGTVLVDQAFARTASRGAVCINISSVDGIDYFPKSVLYSASKAAVIALTAAIAPELAEAGIRVLSVAPGYIATDTVKAVVDAPLPDDTSEPIDIGRTCVRLCSDGGLGLITGQTVVVKTSSLDRV